MAWLSFFSLLVWGLSVPDLTGRVVDQAQLLTYDDEAAIVGQLQALEQGAGIQAAVLTVESLDGGDIESYALQVAEKWKLGKKGADKGLLLIIAPKERRMRWEVGYGLEGDLTDAFTKRLIVEQLAPYFKQGNYAAGISSAFSRIADKLNLTVPEGVAPRYENGGRRKTSLKELIGILGFLFILLPLMVVLGIFQNRIPGGRYRSGGGWGGGGFGGGGWGGGSGGGFSGGGGSFGGGGSSGSW